MDIKYFRLIIILLFCLSPILIPAQGVAINLNGNPPDSSALLDLFSTTKGFLPPRMDSLQRNAISQPADGLMIFNTSSGCLNYYSSGHWVDLCAVSAIQSQNVRLGFSSNTTWTCPQGVTQITIELWGGAGGGGGGAGGKDYPFPYGCSSNGWNYTGGNGGKGGSGGYNKTVVAVVPGSTYSIIIGAGGTGGAGGIGVVQQSTSVGGNGQNGGTTSFHNIISAFGGLGGAGGSSQNAGQYQGFCSNGNSGQHGAVTNFNALNVYVPSITSSRTYLPPGYVHQSISPTCCSEGGNGGIGGSHSNGISGQNGENGYLVISY